MVAARDDEQQADEAEDRPDAPAADWPGSTRIVSTLPPAAHSR